ncbi:MAG: transglycosylase SLT domain-containing protein [Solirubrobacteraceae bacterium]
MAQRRARWALALGGLVVMLILLNAVFGGGALPKPPPAGVAAGASAGNPFAYVASRESDFIARATAGEAHVLFTQSPGGVVLTAARVAAFRPAIDRATAGTGLDPNLLEALVYVESAGRPDAIAGSDPADAAGLTQILASTGQSLLGMHINLALSRALTQKIDAVAAGRRAGRLGPLLAAREAADARFYPAKALSATVRYLQFAQRQFGRADLAVESYHMGVGNLHNVLDAYDGGRAVPYVQLYFDSDPDRHPAAYKLLSGFGDDSELYYWRLLGAEQVMHLYRTARSALIHLASLQTADGAGASVLHPPGRPARYGDPAAVAAAFTHHGLVPLPSNASALGLSYAPSMGAGASKVGAPPSLYRGLAPPALRLLIALAARVRTLSGEPSSLRVQSTVTDRRYQASRGIQDPIATTGYTFTIARRYHNDAQAAAFQSVLDRLQSLNLIAWVRDPSTIQITVASDAASWAR